MLRNYACHAVSGSAFPDWFYSISADYPGETVRAVEQVEGGLCLFSSGTAGDIVPLQRGRQARFQIGRALPGEVLVEIGLEIKRKATQDQLLIVTLSNDTVGYICHSRAYEEGRYEPVSGANLAQGAGEVLIERSLKLLDQLRPAD